MNQLNKLYSAFPVDTAIPVEHRAAAIEVTLARNLAFALPLPSAPVDSIIKHYTETCSALVRNRVADFNEGFPINCRKTMDLVYSIWRYRYLLCHAHADEMQTLMLDVIQVSAEIENHAAPDHRAVLKERISYDCEQIIREFTAKSFG